jgi:hypothetical protein
MLGGGYGTLALATFVAMAVAAALGGARLAIAQAAVGAILTVAVADGQIGPERLIDALIGVGVTLVFSQLLFAPEPVRLLRRAESAALDDMARGLELTAEALGERERRSPRPARCERLTLARTATAVRPQERRVLTAVVRELAAALADLAREPGARAVRQAAADRVLDVARRVGGGPAESDALAAAFIAARTVIADVMVFAGIGADDARAAVEEGTGEFTVPTPPDAPRTPFKTPRRRPAR